MLVDLLSLSIQNATLQESKEQMHITTPHRPCQPVLFHEDIREGDPKSLELPATVVLLFFGIDRSGKPAIPRNNWRGCDPQERRERREKLHEELPFHRKVWGKCVRRAVPSTNKEHALRYAENLRERIAATDLLIDGHKNTVRHTISGGVSAFPGDGRSITELVQAAGDALDEARKRGMTGSRSSISRKPAPKPETRNT